MTGHKSTVCCLSVRDGILYSGSWDGMVRLWWLSEHTPLCILGENEQPLNLAPVLSLSTGTSFAASTHENGYIKVRSSYSVKAFHSFFWLRFMEL